MSKKKQLALMIIQKNKTGLKRGKVDSLLVHLYNGGNNVKEDNVTGFYVVIFLLGAFLHQEVTGCVWAEWRVRSYK